MRTDQGDGPPESVLMPYGIGDRHPGSGSLYRDQSCQDGLVQLFQCGGLERVQGRLLAWTEAMDDEGEEYRVIGDESFSTPETIRRGSPRIRFVSPGHRTMVLVVGGTIKASGADGTTAPVESGEGVLWELDEASDYEASTDLAEYFEISSPTLALDDFAVLEGRESGDT